MKITLFIAHAIDFHRLEANRPTVGTIRPKVRRIAQVEGRILGRIIPLARAIRLKVRKIYGLSHEQCYVHKISVKCRMCMATIHMLFQVRT